MIEAKLTKLGLTSGEIRVCRELFKNKSNPEIADALSIDRRSVVWHLTNIYRKLNVKNRHELKALLQGAFDA